MASSGRPPASRTPIISFTSSSSSILSTPPSSMMIHASVTDMRTHTKAATGQAESSATYVSPSAMRFLYGLAGLVMFCIAVCHWAVQWQKAYISTTCFSLSCFNSLERSVNGHYDPHRGLQTLGKIWFWCFDRKNMDENLQWISLCWDALVEPMG